MMDNSKMKREWNYIDIHTHILPGVDDGASDEREAIIMLEQAYNEGIRTIVATPHYGYRNPTLNQREVTRAWERLTQIVKNKYHDMSVVLGNEIYYRPGVISDIKLGRAKTINNTRYVLTEFSPSVDYHTILDCFYECNNSGYIPIFAHIERYNCLVSNIELVKELKELGAIIQVNCRTILDGGMLGRREWAEQLLQSELVDLIASDCHDDKYRTPIMNSIIDRLVKHIGEEYVYLITYCNPNKIINDDRIDNRKEMRDGI